MGQRWEVGSAYGREVFDGVTACVNRANLPLHLSCGADWRKRTVLRTWACAPFALCARPSSVVLQTELDREKYSESGDKDLNLGTSVMGNSFGGPVLSHANTVGIIGGVSALSTVSFLEKLVRWGVKDGGESPPFIVCSDPELGREFALRNSVPYARSRKARSWFDHTNIVENLRRKRLFLEQTGARCLVMPCHVSCAWFEEVSRGCSVPFLHVGECVADELKEAELKPVETGSNIRIGVVAPDPMLTTSVYQQELQNQGFEVILPDEGTMEHTVIPAIDALNRKDIEGARNLLRIALQVLLIRAVNTIILASDDLQGLLPLDDPLLKKCTNPMDALARCALRWACSKNL